MSIVAAIIEAIVRALLGRWLPQEEKKDEAHAAIEATQEEAKAYAAPARDKSRTLGVLRKHQLDD